MAPTLRETFDAVWQVGYIPRDLPDYLLRNLNPALPLRPYQREALLRLMYYLDGYPQRVRPSQLLFHMATGSGKTLIMVGAILHLYQCGYRDFVFFVNSTNIIEKTRANFLDPLSPKYLFADTIKYGPKQVHITEVSSFQSTSRDDINLLFTTIQGLHARLNVPRENSLTYDDFTDRDVVLISDEAHHINALTKSRLNQAEMLELNTWEATVNRVFRARPGNLLIEFTATVELDHPAIAEKYSDKIAYEYSLRRFREDGYSKEVKVLEADLPPVERALQAVILSQYRRKVAEKHGLLLKPVILMKSRTINDSKQHEGEFKSVIQDLDVARLESLRNRADGPVRCAFNYFAAQRVSMNDLVVELRQDFDEHRCLSVNSQADSEEKQLLVNSLEDPANQIRVIFAVDKLNEGWDVLNLFDIVRLYNTRDAKRGVPGRTTISEAQLIGRGARYYPFQVHPAQPRDQRKYDVDLDSELRMLETLYYHSAQNPRYIAELHAALVATGIMPPTAKTVHLRVKDSFKNTDFWRSGAVYVNRRIENPRNEVLGFRSIAIPERYSYQLQTGFSHESALLDTTTQTVVGQRQIVTQAMDLLCLGEHVIRTAMQRLEFYQFANLKHYFPHLESSHEFTTSVEYLGGVIVDVTGAPDQIACLTQEQKLDIAVGVLEGIDDSILAGTSDFIGTKTFYPIGIQYCVKDKRLNITLNDSGDQERGRAMSETANSTLRLDLSNEAWYVYDENYGTAEEKHLVRFVHGLMAKLQQRYAEVYLIRNEKLFQLHRFSDGATVEPDFVLFAVERVTQKAIIHQLFLEPKGRHLIDTDLWKQQFLLELAQEYKLVTLFEDSEYRVAGLPFYNETLTKTAFEKQLRRTIPW